jgi:mono/diheme cytochrome c family protein
MRGWLLAAVMASMATGASAAEKTAAQRGREALVSKSYGPPMFMSGHYENLWKAWGLKEKPADFARRLRERYGLHEPDYENGGLPMGFRAATGLFGKGVGNDCMMCHASSLFGKTVMGLGNSSLDLQAIFDDAAHMQGMKTLAPYAISNVRGTSEAAASAVYLFQFRNPDLSVRAQPNKMAYAADTCDDVPAWWNMKKKTTMYHSGSHSSRAVRSLMIFMISPLNSADFIKRSEADFKDISQYLLSLEPPKYPFPIDRQKAETGRKVFEATCARCHGTYGDNPTYPNKIVDLDTIGTDRRLIEGFDGTGTKVYNESWFAQELGPDGKPLRAVETGGYQAPPLDGVWATAPYFHNGAAPTIYHVVNSKARPRIFTRSYRTEKDDYDTERIGWKTTVLDKAPGPEVPAIERRKVYDTTQPGRSNGGHTFGDKLSEDERRALLEYLKTL